MHWESDTPPETPTRRQRLKTAIRVAVRADAETTEEWEANLLDAIERFMDDWNREQITQHAEVDGWMLSVRNALLKRLVC
jgi:hypothetical protein